ncbi:hypothetical protein [Sciscionella marina]|uniref:hypothetical protein n=1 Tax=Sciscionella marina TaxID=508770 RepID=UPI00037993BC|nr:hypothetical protein [Sciscionella marina]
MSEDAPTLAPTAQELWQWAQALGMVRDSLARARERRGRLAHAEDEHAARLDEARERPPARAMTTAEQERWAAALGESAYPGWQQKPISVQTGPLPGEDDNTIVGWGVHATSWDRRGLPTASAWVVCRDHEDAKSIATMLRNQPSKDAVIALHTAATATPAGALTAAQRRSPAAEPIQRGQQPPSLPVEAWEAALRAELPDRLTSQVIVHDPNHPHFGASRQLYAKAVEEVDRVGADPARLARLIHTVPSWTDKVRNPPSLAHWAIAESSTSPSYEQLVRADPTTEHNTNTSTSSETQTTPTRIDTIHTHEQALGWAHGLQANNPMDRLAAKQGFGHFGSDVDAMLTAKFPGLLDSTRQAADAQRANPTKISSEGQPVLRPDPAELVAHVETLEPDKPVDRLAARTMLGRSSTTVDAAIAYRFSDDPAVAERLAELYPDGIPDTPLWQRAQTDQEHAADEHSVADDPATTVREDQEHEPLAEQLDGLAASERAIARRSAHKPPQPTVRRSR